MKYLRIITAFVFLSLLAGLQPLAAEEETVEEEVFTVKTMILEHLGDSYDWHITNWGERSYSIPLPVIVFGGEKGGLNIFLSSRFNHGHDSYRGFYLSGAGKYKGKVVTRNEAGEEIRPWDFSLTRNAVSLIISSIILVSIILYVARWYRKQEKDGEYKAPKGFVGLMEMFIMSIQDDIIKPCVGKDYRKFSPYLLTAFFFIFINNVMGLIPIFPGGANVTGNITITLALGACTFFIVNIFGSREYWKEIFWPEVPTWLKVPIPIMPAIELVGIFTKPFALIIRLFANMLGGHSIVLGLVCLIFVAAELGAAITASMTVLSVVLTVFMDLVELLVAYIQAYVFTMLSAIFIGLARVEPHKASDGHYK